MSEIYLGSVEFVLVKDLIDVFFILLFSLIGKAIPNLILVLNIAICRQRTSKSNNAQSYLKHMFLFVYIYNLGRDRLMFSSDER